MSKCNYCSGELKEYFMVNYKEYCSIFCVFDGYKSLGQRLIEGLKEAVQYEKGEKDLKTTKRYKTKQTTQKQKRLHKKGPKQKKVKK